MLTYFSNYLYVALLLKRTTMYWADLCSSRPRFHHLKYRFKYVKAGHHTSHFFACQSW